MAILKCNFFKNIIPAILSFEMAFVLFVFAGRYKGASLFSWFPLDYTMTFYVLCVGILIYMLYLNTIRINSQVFLLLCTGLLFCIWPLCTLIWSPGSEYATSKALKVASLNTLCLLGGVIISSNYYRVRNLFFALFIFSLLFIIIALYNYFSVGGYFITVAGSYLSVGYLIGLCVILCIGIIIFNMDLCVNKNVFFLVAGLGIFVLMVMGARGPIFSIIASFLILFISVKLKNNSIYVRYYHIILAFSVIALPAIFYFLYQSGYSFTTMRRLDILFSEIWEGNMESKRAYYFVFSIKMWQQAPLLGNGVGSFPVLYEGVDQRLYPHNMFLETMFELGVIGLLLLLFTIFWGLKLQYNVRHNFIGMNWLIIMLFVYAFMRTMFSGDLADNRLFFVMLGLLGYSYKEKK